MKIYCVLIEIENTLPIKEYIYTEDNIIKAIKHAKEIIKNIRKQTENTKNADAIQFDFFYDYNNEELRKKIYDYYV